MNPDNMPELNFSFQLDEFYLDLQEDGNKLSLLDEAEINDGPFPGLRPFKTSECQIFKGRGGQEEELIKRLKNNHFLAVIGSSGTGKSSLVRAGLIPQLFGGYLHEAGNKWNIAICRPGKDPVSNLAIAISSVKGKSKDKDVILKEYQTISPLLSNSVYGILEANELLNNDPQDSARNLLIIVDQFEELFRFSRNDPERENSNTHFVNLLLKASQNTAGNVYVIITMRSEFLGDCVKYRGLPEAINEGQYLVPQLNRNQLKETIEGPLNLAHKDIEPGLVELLINEIDEGKLKENLDQLPILQHALMRTYRAAFEDKTGDSIKHAHYEAIGGMRGALADHAEAKYESLGDASASGPSKKQQIAKIVFQALTDQSTDSKGGRRPTELKNIYAIAASINAEPHEVDEVINHFRDRKTSFIMPPADTNLYPDLILDISHESLMRNWVRLRDWISEEVQSGKLYSRLNDRRALSEENKLNDEWIRGALLEDMIEWKTSYPINAAWAARYDQTTRDDVNQTAISTVYDKNFLFLSESQKKSKQAGQKKMFMGVLIVCLALGFGIYTSVKASQMKAEKKLSDSLKTKADSSAKEAQRERMRAKEADHRTILSIQQAQRANEAAAAAIISRQKTELKAKIAMVEAAQAKANQLNYTIETLVDTEKKRRKTDSLEKVTWEAMQESNRLTLAQMNWWNNKLNANLNKRIADTLLEMRKSPNTLNRNIQGADNLEKSLIMVHEAKQQMGADYGSFLYLAQKAREYNSNPVTNMIADSVHKTVVPYRAIYKMPATSRSTYFSSRSILRFIPESKTQAFLATGQRGLYYFNNTSKEPTQITKLSYLENILSISDDATKLITYDRSKEGLKIYTIKDSTVSEIQKVKIAKSERTPFNRLEYSDKAVLSPDNMLLAVCTNDFKYLIFNIKKGIPVKTVPCNDGVISFSFSNDGKKLLVCQESSVEMLSIDNERITNDPIKLTFPPEQALNPATFLNAFFSKGDTVHVIDSHHEYVGLSTKPLKLKTSFSEKIVNFIGALPDQKLLIVAEKGNSTIKSDFTIDVKDPVQKTTSYFPWHSKNHIKAIAVAKNNAGVLTGDEKAIYFWNAGNRLNPAEVNSLYQKEALRSYYYQKAVDEQTAGKNQDAITNLYASINIDSTYAASWEKLGDVQAANHKHAQAADSYLRLVNLDPENKIYLNKLSGAYLDDGNYRKADSVANTILKLDTTYSNAWNLLAISASGNNNSIRAIEYYKKALALNPTSPIISNNLALEYLQVNDISKADSLVQTALRLNSNSSVAWRTSAIINSKRKLYTVAIDNIRHSLLLDSTNALSWHELSYLYDRTNQPEQALSAQTKMSIYDPFGEWNECDLAYFSNKAGKYTKAITHSNASIFQHPKLANAYAHRAYANFKLGNYDLVLPDLEKSIHLDSLYNKPAFYYACFYARKNDREKALGYLRTAIDRGFDDVAWLTKEESFVAMRKDPEFLAIIARMNK